MKKTLIALTSALALVFSSTAAMATPTSSHHMPHKERTVKKSTLKRATAKKRPTVKKQHTHQTVRKQVRNRMHSARR